MGRLSLRFDWFKIKTLELLFIVLEESIEYISNQLTKTEEKNIHIYSIRLGKHLDLN